MSEDWKAGDVVQWDGTVCIHCDTFDNTRALVSERALYRVERVDFDAAYGCPGIWLAGIDCGNDGVCAKGFRKLNDEPDDAELIERIKRCQPARIPELPRITVKPVKLDPAVWGVEIVRQQTQTGEG